MKRVGFLYEKLYEMETLAEALKQACKGKKKTKSVCYALAHKEEFLIWLADLLKQHKFVPGQNRIKTVFEPASGKVRQIEIPPSLPDRVVHWAVCIVLKPIFMKGMYPYCIGSVPGRGGDKGRRYIKNILRRDKKIKYVMKLDIRKFFQSVSQDKMKALFRDKIKDKEMLDLLDMIIDAGSQGLPIGFYTSQWFSNFYLEKVDHFIKERLRIRYYVRNVDDMVMLDTNKRKLHRVLDALREYLRANDYAVEIKDNWQIWKLNSRPLDFLGFVFYKEKTQIRKRNFFRFMRRVTRVRKRGYCTLRAARGITSGIGWLKHLPHGRHYYLNYIKPIISKGELRRIISAAAKRENALKKSMLKGAVAV